MAERSFKKEVEKLNLDKMIELTMILPAEGLGRGFPNEFHNKLCFVKNIVRYLNTHENKVNYEKLKEQDWWNLTFENDPRGNLRNLYSASEKTVFEMIERIKLLDNRSLNNVLITELNAVSEYTQRFEKDKAEINSRYEQALEEIKKVDLCDNYVERSLKDAAGKQVTEAEYLHRPFIKLGELKKYSEGLDLAYFPVRVKMNSSFGYDPHHNQYCKLEALRALKENNGRTWEQRRKDKAKERIDAGLIEMLESIAEYDCDKEVAILAKGMVQLYEMTESFKV